MTVQTPEVGDIIYSVSGYDCTIHHFYQVVSKSAGWVSLQPLAKGFAEGSDSVYAYSVPTGEAKGKPIRRKVKTEWGFWAIRISAYEWAQSIYEGKPLQGTSPVSM
jgi:hypothetical protein